MSRGSDNVRSPCHHTGRPLTLTLTLPPASLTCTGLLSPRPERLLLTPDQHRFPRTSSYRSRRFFFFFFLNCGKFGLKDRNKFCLSWLHLYKSNIKILDRSSQVLILLLFSSSSKKKTNYPTRPWLHPTLPRWKWKWVHILQEMQLFTLKYEVPIT